MNNIERAEQVIASWVQSHHGDLDGLPEALAEAGLLMPDLPELDSEGGWAEGWASVGIDSEGFVYMDVPHRPHHPERARRIAYGILAASDEAEMTSLAEMLGAGTRTLPRSTYSPYALPCPAHGHPGGPRCRANGSTARTNLGHTHRATGRGHIVDL